MFSIGGGVYKVSLLNLSGVRKLYNKINKNKLKTNYKKTSLRVTGQEQKHTKIISRVVTTLCNSSLRAD